MENNIEEIRHSLSHIMAQAILSLYPKTKFGIGPAIENGFYYDFLLTKTLAPEDLQKIEAKMKEIILQNQKFTKKNITKLVAKKLFKDQPFKLELIKDLPGKTVSTYTTATAVDIGSPRAFVDLCKGPHIKNTSEIKPDTFKLTKIAGAYWKGNEKNKMLTRIYGLAFSTKEELQNYVKMQEEAEKRDHRILGEKLDLFTFSDMVGSGLPLFTPKGALIRRLLNEYIEELQSKADYQQVWTPQIVKAELFKTSGHYDKYKDDMFNVHSHYSKEEFFLKPMNCPQHTQIFGSKPRSYKDLPIRLTDFAMLYRDEQPGQLSGLARVRSFSQDDCHIFCTEEQVDQEIDKALAMIKKVMNTFGFKYRYRLSTRDPKNLKKYLGDKKTWDKVEKWAEKIMERNKIEYFPGPGEAAFYAPKMDLMATDVLGREWQLSTTQIDFVMPERFNLSYTAQDGTKKRPVMLHRAILGSSERFMMIVIEHYAGAFPLWLSPVQVSIIPISEKHLEYASKIKEKLLGNNIRVEIRDEAETLGKKIRTAEMQKIPYLLILGDKEIQANALSVRQRSKGDLGQMLLQNFIDKINNEIINKI